MPDTSAVYRPRKPQNSPYYQCVEDHFEEFERIYADRFPKKYGFFKALRKAGHLSIPGLWHPAQRFCKGQMWGMRL